MPRIKRADRADQSRGMHMSGIRHASQKPALNLSGLFFFYQDWNETFHVLLPFPLCPPSKISTFSLTSPAPSAHALSNYCQSASHDPHGIMGHEAAWWKGKPQLVYTITVSFYSHHGTTVTTSAIAVLPLTDLNSFCCYWSYYRHCSYWPCNTHYYLHLLLK